MGGTQHGNAAASAQRIWHQIAHHRSKILWIVAGALATALWTPYAELLEHRIALRPWYGLYVVSALCLMAFVFWALIGSKGREIGRASCREKV